ncbi:MAG: ABC transporter ATP-binding protein [Candidatus Accumulibacter sp.]|jgi:lipopolysaccharide transport system ATP-binding protein|nr:ABC transporter ATP-binding protein [Accumulibacter sp.]
MGSIAVYGLGKAYRHYRSRWGRLAEWLLPGSPPRHELKWVLRDIDFQVFPGEAVGIIGINGAGKSTLLKLITGTTCPTAGEVALRGRVAAMLELGMGFHPDFTGRQNAFMAGQLIGLERQEIARLMPKIEAFAEIGEAIDQPVRVYSSGMQVRLAFAVATASRPDVLVIDEALSVGDAYFQHKSFERIRSFNREGTTLLIVSHDRQAIQSICDRALLLDGGRIALEGAPEAVMDYYNALLADRQNQHVVQEMLENGRARTVSGTGEATVSDIALLDEAGRRIETARVGQALTLRVAVRTHAPIERLVFGYGIRDRLGQVVYGTNTYHTQQALHGLPAGCHLCFDIRFAACLGPGNYAVQTALVDSDTHLDRNYEWRDLALTFDVINVDKPHFSGIAWIEPEISIERT